MEEKISFKVGCVTIPCFMERWKFYMSKLPQPFIVRPKERKILEMVFRMPIKTVVVIYQNFNLKKNSTRMILTSTARLLGWSF